MTKFKRNEIHQIKVLKKPVVKTLSNLDYRKPKPKTHMKRREYLKYVV